MGQGRAGQEGGYDGARQVGGGGQEGGGRRAGQGRAGQGRAGQCRAGQVGGDDGAMGASVDGRTSRMEWG